MNLFCQSVKFSDCPAKTGDELVLDGARLRDFLHIFRNCPQITDSLILNTCNRLEFYFYAKKTFDVASFVNSLISHNSWNEYNRCFTGLEAVEHLFRVAGGIDSQIIGENEIVAQLKESYKLANSCNSIKSILHHLMHSSFRVAKSVRTDTKISAGALSIAQAAVELAAGIIEISKAKVLIVGSGTNAELIARHLMRKKVQDLTVSARNFSAAGLLIEKTTGRFAPLNELRNCVSNADIVFTASAAQEPLIKSDMLEAGSKPLILIDLSVPHNIEPQIKNISNIRHFNIDSLGEIIKANNLKRRNEISKAQAIIDEHLRAFSTWQNGLISAGQFEQKVVK